MFLKTFTNEHIRRAYIKMLVKAVLSVLCVGIGVFLTVACIVHYQNCEKNVQPLEEITTRGGKNDMRLASYELTSLPEYIGTVDELSYYFIYSPGSNNEFCVIYMYDTDYSGIEKELKEKGKVSLEGVLEKLTEPMVEAYIHQYVEQNNIKVDTTGESLEDYIYGYPVLYCSEMSGFKRFINLSYMYLLGIFIFGLWGISTISDNLKAVIRSRSISPLGINYAERVNEELNLANTKWFEINKLYITQNYLVVLGSAILFLRKDAITKVYGNTIEDYSQGGLTYVKEIYAEYRDDGETYVIAKVPIHSLQKKTLEKYQMEQDDIFACLQRTFSESI